MHKWIRKPKEWFDKNERLNVNHDLKVGDRIYHQGMSYQKVDEPWIVISIKKSTEDCHGFVDVKREAYICSYEEVTDDPDYNDNFENYCYNNWKRFFRLIT